MHDTWIGNIYMLDFTDRGILLIDRIQIPKDIPAGFMLFFKGLAEVFQEMFSVTAYKEILMPRTISNHNKIQAVFNKYKDTLPKNGFTSIIPLFLILRVWPIKASGIIMSYIARLIVGTRKIFVNKHREHKQSCHR